jgi:hypothetical protein
MSVGLLLSAFAGLTAATGVLLAANLSTDGDAAVGVSRGCCLCCACCGVTAL